MPALDDGGAVAHPPARQLVIVLGDQLDPHSAACDGFDPARDAILQMEVREEATTVPQHNRRIAFSFAAPTMITARPPWEFLRETGSARPGITGRFGVLVA